jgi:3-Oxoacyl-[acyl-carrier-protein (ACP)] synthase III
MKILGAGIAVPGSSGQDALAYACDYAVKAARRALSKARCLASELELIVSLSVSPSRMADAPCIVGPRLAHPVQRDLRATNAAVFDLLDADWTLALDFAQSHCRQLGYRRALVVRADTFADAEGKASSGLSDGAGAIVLTAGHIDRFHASYADLDAPILVSLDAVPARHTHETGIVARFHGLFDAAAGRFTAQPVNAQAAARAVVHDVQSRIDAARFELFRESWLSGWLSADEGFESACEGDQLIDGAADIPPAFQLPAWLAMRTSDATPVRRDAQTVFALTLDVFKPRVACIAMEV